MARKTEQLSIYMNGMRVGSLTRESSGILEFKYDSDWIAWTDARPISLSMPLTNIPYKGDIVYSYFDNLLPDNTRIRGRIQRKFQTPTNQPFDLLAKIGKDCVGAIQLIVIGENQPTIEKRIAFETLSNKELATILRNYQEYPLGMTDNNKEFRISIAGAQEKSAFLYQENKWCRPLGDTPTTHIFKLPIGYIQHQQLDLSDSCENEWLCSQIAASFGLAAAKCNIQHFEDVKVLVVERFDRKPSQDQSWLLRLPQEDMCQALHVPPDLKYQSDGGPGIKDIMNLLLGSSQTNEDRENFFRAQILFWLLAAIDGHAKNFSLFIEAGGSYRLTPLYDIMSAYPLIAKKQLQKQKIKMAMALKGENNHYHWHNIHRRYFISAAKDANFSTKLAEDILDDMLAKVDHVIEEVTEQLPDTFPKQISQSIFDGMKLMKNRLEK